MCALYRPASLSAVRNEKTTRRWFSGGRICPTERDSVPAATQLQQENCKYSLPSFIEGLHIIECEFVAQMVKEEVSQRVLNVVIAP